jgi:hypothetical protein
MKKITLFKVILISISFVFTCYSQALTQEEKKDIITSLDSSSYVVRWSAINTIKDSLIIEALPKVEQLIWRQEHNLQLNFLEALTALGSAKAKEYALAYIDSIDHYRDLRDSLENKARAAGCLFKLNDYSQVKCVFDLIDRRDFSSQIVSINLLPEIIKNAPQYSEKAKTELETMALSAKLNFCRTRAIFYLNKIYGEGVLPIMIKAFKEDPDVSNRSFLLEYYLMKYKSQEINTLLKERLYADSSLYVKSSIVDVLLDSLGSPEDYNAVINYNLQNTDVESRNHINFLIRNYSPIKPDSSVLVDKMIDNLSSMLSSAKQSNWIGDEQFVSSLNNKLSNAKDRLSAKDSLTAAKNITDFQNTVTAVCYDSLNPDTKFVKPEALAYLYYYSDYIMDKLPAIPLYYIKLCDSKRSLLKEGKVQYYENGWQDAVDKKNGYFYFTTMLKKLALRITYASGTQTLSDVTPKDTMVFSTKNVQIKLQDSKGAAIDTGYVKYYSNGWQNFGQTTNGIAEKELLPISYTFRMTYASGSVDKLQKIDSSNIVLFQTANTQVKLQDSKGAAIDTGYVKYYSNGWQNFGQTTNGIAEKELLPISYTFRMAYAYGSVDKLQKIDSSNVVLFQTANTQVKLQNSKGNLIDAGYIKYYSNGWQNFGQTTNGIAEKELLPISYTFRMTYAYGSADKLQKIDSSNVVLFQTANTQVKLQDSKGAAIDTGYVKYYSNGWQNFGQTTNGIAEKELLPISYTFRMTYASGSVDKLQKIDSSNIVLFQTANTQVKLQDSKGAAIDTGYVKYYSNGWQNFGQTTNGIAEKELLPISYSFRMTYGNISSDINEDISKNNIVTYSTILCKVSVKDQQNLPLSNVETLYYSNGWLSFGLTVNGEAVKEMLAGTIPFRAQYGTAYVEKTQNILNNNTVEFLLNTTK